MTRILITLASLSLMLLAAAITIGLFIGDLYALPLPGQETLHWATIHRLTGISAALVVVFVESVILIYFIGTSRWCKEVVDTYQLDCELSRNSNRLKRRTFPWAVSGMLAVVGIVALGGATDPGTGRANTADWAQWHLAGALGGFAWIAWTYVVSWNNVFAQHAIIQRIVAQVAEARRARGLDDGCVDANGRMTDAGRSMRVARKGT